MNQKFNALMIAAFVAFSSMMLAAEQFPDQPNVQGAFNKLTATLAQLDKAKLETPGEHVKNAIVHLDSAKTFLDQATNNKGTYLRTAKDLCDQAKAALEATPPDLDKATEIANRALHEVNMAGKAGRRVR